MEDGTWEWAEGQCSRGLSAASLALAPPDILPTSFHPPVASEFLPEGGLWPGGPHYVRGEGQWNRPPQNKTRGVQNMPALNMPLWCINWF